jgi:hypothetical protein
MQDVSVFAPHLPPIRGPSLSLAVSPGPTFANPSSLKGVRRQYNHTNSAAGFDRQTLPVLESAPAEDIFSCTWTVRESPADECIPNLSTVEYVLAYKGRRNETLGAIPISAVCCSPMMTRVLASLPRQFCQL